MNKSGRNTWAGHVGSKVASGLLIGAGILLMVLTQFLVVRLARQGFFIGIILVATGLIRLLMHSTLHKKMSLE